VARSCLRGVIRVITGESIAMCYDRSVEKWHAVLCALRFHPIGARAADDVNGAAHDLARQTAAFAAQRAGLGRVRNASSLGSADSARRAGALKPRSRKPAAGQRRGASGELRLTLSENQSQYLLVEEAQERRAAGLDGRMETDRPAAALPAWRSTGIGVGEEEQILDVAFPAQACWCSRLPR